MLPPCDAVVMGERLVSTQAGPGTEISSRWPGDWVGAIEARDRSATAVQQL